MTPDVNVLVAASRADHPHHGVALAWLNAAIAQASVHADLGLLVTVVVSFLRLVTHPKIFVLPTPTAQAVFFIDSLLACPGVQMMAVEGEWAQLRTLCIDQSLKGNDLPDAWIAASVLQRQETLVTFDRDFITLLPPKRLQLLQSTD